MYQASGHGLAPKCVGPFEYVFLHDGTLQHDGSGTYGRSERNAVLRHELRGEGFPTSGVSTTPIRKQARKYARGKGAASSGYIFKIDRDVLAKHGVREYVVADWIPRPSFPEDKEVILVAAGGGSLPQGIVVCTMAVRAKTS
jgi:hypothetical protein